jgi:O-antigen/teichoic acid export membrane protein
METKQHTGRRIAVRASWNLIDQGLSAASNVALTVVIARSADADGFGHFSVAFLLFGLIVGFTRSVVGGPLQVRASTDTAASFDACRRALGAAVVFGAGSGALCATAAGVLWGDLGQTLLAVALCLPVLLLQDTCRFVFFSTGRARQAAVNDALWSFVEFAILALMLRLGVSNAAVLILAWGGGAAVAAGYGLRQLHAAPVLRGAAVWVWRQRDLGGYLAAEYVLGQGVTQASVLLFGLIGSASGLGSLRAAQVLLGPLAICGAAAFTFTVPEVARQPDLSARRRHAISWMVSAVMGLLTLMYAGLLLLLPDQVGVWLLGDTWRGASQVLLAVSAASFASALATGPAAVMYGMGRARSTFGVHLLTAPLLPTGVLMGNAVGGTSGAAWGIAIASAVEAPAWFYRLRGIIGAKGAPTSVPVSG